MLRIGICDDSADARIALRAALERALDRRKGEGTFFEFSSGEGLLRWMEKHAGELDLVFLDIEMGELDGMETARRLRLADEGLQLVFVTGYTDYVFDGYSVGALGYLMKPPQPDRLDEVLDRGLEARLRDGDKAFLCRSGETMYRIPKKSILYFASDRRQVSCVAAARTYTFYGKLDEVERAVGEGFVRIHQRYLVRSAAVDRLEGSQVFIGEEALPVSRACRSAALAALARTALES
ncbi:LytTR family DNA-binding domain-containing protein [Oscillibacter sp.]|jgi:two-component system response regulator LytT|uniref:LytR/AlgR family response regulator transcription factor n=1 Tax=Oscillibacter sp. TaxID=1945593 RepID=UPI00216E52DE|nr:LytTR family DNA-binding domain-containing protein [Oscillibacter sp.]MCI9650253.1 response regulator transcription factor [Oscillibacter sp.]